MADEPNYVLIERRLIEPFVRIAEIEEGLRTQPGESVMVAYRHISALSTALAVARDVREVVASAAQLALEAIDNIITSHRGQHEYGQLKAAFDALESALTLLGGERGEETGSAVSQIAPADADLGAEPSAPDTPCPHCGSVLHGVT